MTKDIQKTTTIVLQKKDKDLVSYAAEHAPEDVEVRVLAEGKAVEFDIKAVDNIAYQKSLIKTLADRGIQADVCVQNKGDRKKKLLICDMDSTLIGQECIDEIADFAKVKKRVSAITEKAMRGEIGFEDALTERVLMLRGLPLSVLRECYEKRITLNEGARVLCQTMKASGAKTVIVSGGFTFFTSRIALDTGFDAHQANVLKEDAGKLTGDVEMPILGREAKFEAIKDHSEEFGGPLSAIAIGDGANDLGMITAAGLGVAYYAKPAVAAAAHCAINHTDLTTALYYQGYKESDFKA